MQNDVKHDRTSPMKAPASEPEFRLDSGRAELPAVSRRSIAWLASAPFGPRICFSPDEGAGAGGDAGAGAGDAGAGGDKGAGGDAGASARPDWLGEQFWDEGTKAIKGADLKAHLDDLTAFKASEESRRAAVPEKADGYELKLPADFKLGEGEAFEIDQNDPMFAFGREVAHKAGLDQAGFESLVGMYAQMKVAESKELNTAVEAQLKALGANGQQRREAVNTFLTAKLGKDAGAIFEHVLMTKTGVEAVERLMRMVSGGGMPAVSGAGRETGKDSKIEGWESMSAAEKMAAARRR
jgi:hypothetical protein